MVGVDTETVVKVPSEGLSGPGQTAEEVIRPFSKTPKLGPEPEPEAALPTSASSGIGKAGINEPEPKLDASKNNVSVQKPSAVASSGTSGEVTSVFKRPSPSASSTFDPKRKKREIFQHGNYNRYYGCGYRTSLADKGDDLRLRAFPKNFFRGKDILDVGCNIGHITWTIAKNYGANLITGIDIDPKLVIVAKKNIAYYSRKTGDQEKRKIPFPYNVAFKEENYVLNSDEMLSKTESNYDIILALSISKWVHLNNGDEGLKRFFRRAHRELRPGGKFVLEPQPWSSYSRRKKLTEKIHETFKSIKLLPQQFEDYLLNEVGFCSVEKLPTPPHPSKGFQRPLIVFTKAEVAKNSAESAAGTDPDPNPAEKPCEATSTVSHSVSAESVTDASEDGSLKEISKNKEVEVIAHFEPNSESKAARAS